MGKTIYDRVSVLPSVGQKRQEALNQLGIFTILDLLSHFPFRYEDIKEKTKRLAIIGKSEWLVSGKYEGLPRDC